MSSRAQPDLSSALFMAPILRAPAVPTRTSMQRLAGRMERAGMLRSAA